MALRLLVMARDSPTNQAASWRQGDVVVAAPGNHVWGQKETLPIFIQVDLSDATRVDADVWLEEELRGEELIARRKVRMRTADVEDTRDNREGRLETNKADFDTKIETRPARR